jgi:hypothetical protein
VNNREIMKELFTQFIADYLDRSTRPFAQMNLLRGVDYYRAALEGEQVEVVVSSAMKFVERYEKSWPWKRSLIVARSLRTFNGN